MCNHYRSDIKKLGLQYELWGFEEFSETKIRQRLQDVMEDVWPDRPALVGVLDEAGVKPVSMRWGFPPVDTPPGQPKARVGTNVRHPHYPNWRDWLEPAHRCIVPVTSFAEPHPETKKDVFFESVDGAPLAFAGIWCPWEGQRGTKKEPVIGEHKLFAFLTTKPNAVVEPIHKKAMPVILAREDWETWLTAPWKEAKALHRPAPDDLLHMAG